MMGEYVSLITGNNNIRWGSWIKKIWNRKKKKRRQHYLHSNERRGVCVSRDVRVIVVR